jgi:hypothetical protein
MPEHLPDGFKVACLFQQPSRRIVAQRAGPYFARQPGADGEPMTVAAVIWTVRRATGFLIQAQACGRNRKMMRATAARPIKMAMVAPDASSMVML